MGNPLSRRSLLGASALGLGLAALPWPASASGFRVLVFSRTTVFRHSSIPAGIACITELGREHGFAVDATEDPAVFNQSTLDSYATVVFLNTTGTVLDTAAQRDALERFVRRGGGFVGVHAAADTEYDWPFYDQLVGTHFLCHPAFGAQPGTLVTEDHQHPASAHLADRFSINEEFYSFRRNPRPDVHVLLTVDEHTYLPDPNTSNSPINADGTYNPHWLPGVTGYMSGKRGVPGDHPMSWTHRNLGGAVFYTALGHQEGLYDKDWYRRHLLGGILSTLV